MHKTKTIAAVFILGLAVVCAAVYLPGFMGGIPGAVTPQGAGVGFFSPGGVPEAVAVLLTAPALTSACVITYVFVHVTLAPGASDPAPAGQVTGPTLASVMAIAVSVCAPVLVTTKL